jgi:hypothetical protein
MGRGPSYPFIDLEEAIAATKKIYDYTKRAAAPTDAVVANALSYSLKSSGGVKTIAALKSYGLIEESTQTVKITDRAYRILIDTPESSERKQAIKDAALSPKWYQSVFTKWGGDPPASTRSTLILEHGFIPTTVDSFLKNYRQTIQYAGLEEDSANDMPYQSLDSSPEKGYTPKIGDWVQWETQGCLRLPEAKRVAVFIDDGKFAILEGSSNPVPAAELIPSEAPAASKTALNVAAPAIGGIKMLSETYNLSAGIILQLHWPSQIEKVDFDDFVYQLDGIKRKLERAIKKDGPPDTGVTLEE